MGREVEGDGSDLEANNSRPRKRRDSVGVGQLFIIFHFITLHLPWSSGCILWGVDNESLVFHIALTFLGFCFSYFPKIKYPRTARGKAGGRGGEGGGAGVCMVVASHGTTFMMHHLWSVFDSVSHRCVI